MAGRAAEEIFMGPDNITSGASSDFQSASSLAYAMITKWGMSEKVGFINSSQKQSDQVQSLVDNEVKKLLDDSYAQAKSIILKNRDKMENLVQELIKKETLTGDEILQILNVKGKTLPKMNKSLI
ncbi:hypothetical protein DLAC_11541 [Tieghemostelium lacteum]|uniref:Peptidase M41 domain-containing protein n=1 Tax=Tieghemostelium lacteum TaxID=361077 RepID=A0A152A2B8_TIELA|nr:hypothetical protein DLAC_11541 [Tieghemostelium lacteum]|eukprot:KYR00366.1 hypothetical protein DLAC_11541 [Tieghemostelium lacteum]